MSIFLDALQIPKLSATPAAPPSGFVYIYALSDNNIYQLDASGVETNLNLSGSAGASDGSVSSVLSANLTLAVNKSLVYAGQINAATFKLTAPNGSIVLVA